MCLIDLKNIIIIFFCTTVDSQGALERKKFILRRCVDVASV